MGRNVDVFGCFISIDNPSIIVYIPNAIFTFLKIKIKIVGSSKDLDSRF